MPYPRALGCADCAGGCSGASAAPSPCGGTAVATIAPAPSNHVLPFVLLFLLGLMLGQGGKS